MNSDPFRHLPALRGRIVDPETSRYRAGLPTDEEWQRRLEEAGFPPNYRLTAEEREERRQRTMAGREDRELWIFGYGSLMWDPGILFDEVRVGAIADHHRSFCLKMLFGRGSREMPGLMAALDRGGSCHGLAYRVAPADTIEESRRIFRREMNSDSYQASFHTVATPQGPIDALTFVINRDSERYQPDLSLEERARMIGTGSGFVGTNLEYLDKLVAQLDCLGLTDDFLRALHRRACAVAQSCVAPSAAGSMAPSER